MNNFPPESHPKVRALAKLAVQRIKALTNAHNAQIEAIYRDFQTQCSLTPTTTEGQDGEASADELDNPSADSDSQPTDKPIQELN